MTPKKNPLELKMLDADSNPRLKELLDHVMDDAQPQTARHGAKPAWGRRFSASGKMMGAPRILLTY